MERETSRAASFLPALYAGLVAGRVHVDTRIILTSRSGVKTTVEEWLTDVFGKNVPACGVEAESLKQFTKMVDIVALGLTEGGDDWADLSQN